MPSAAGRPSKRVRRPREVELDTIDRELLRLLADDARTPNNVLASRVGLAPSTCLMRVRRLREAGVITGYRVELDPASVGRALQALVSVRLQSHARSRIADHTQRFATVPGVLNVFFLAGSDDFMLHVAVRTAEDLRDLVSEHLSSLREVAHTETHLIFEHVATGPAPLLAPLPGD